MEPDNSITSPAVKTICKDAWNKVIAVNAVKETIGEMSGKLDFLSSPEVGLFTFRERTAIDTLFQEFSTGTKDILDRKFNVVGSILEDCIKRETRSRPAPSDVT